MKSPGHAISIVPGLEVLEPRVMLSGAWLPAVSIDGKSISNRIGLYSSIALDNNEEPSVAYYDVTGQQLRYIEKAGASWLNPHQISVTFHDVGRYSSLAMDANGNPHISFYDGTSGNLMYTYWDPGPWSPAKIVDGQAPSGTDGNMGLYSSLALDSKGMAHIVYYDATKKNLMYAKQTGLETWERSVITSVGSVSEGGYPVVHRLVSLAIDQWDRPHVSFFDADEKDSDNNPTKVLQYGVQNGGVWEIQRVDPDNPSWHGWDNFLCLDHAGRPRIAYVEQPRLMYAALTDSGWEKQYVAGGYFTYLAMDLDGNDNPHIVYQDIYNFRYIGYRDGVTTNWVYPDGWGPAVTIDVGGAALPETGMYGSIAMDSQGNAHVSCYQDWSSNGDYGALRYIYGAGVGLPASPDVKVSVDYNNFGTEWLPGETVQIPVTLTNIGLLKAAGSATLELYYSDDQTIGSDTFLLSVPVGINLAPGQSTVFTLKYTVPADAGHGSRNLVLNLVNPQAMGEFNDENNALLIMGSVSWKLGTFDDKKDYALTVKDAQDNLVTFSLKGGGYGYVDGPSFGSIEVYGTNSKSALSITSKSKGVETSVGRIEVEGPLASLLAPMVDLRGDLRVHGTLSALALNDVDVSHKIEINYDKKSVDPKLACTIAMDQVQDCDLLTYGVPIKSLTVTQWLGNGSDIEAPWIGSLLVKGDPKRQPAVEGDFEANLKLSGDGNPKLTLGSATINGSVDGALWNITGPVGPVTVAQEVSGSQIGGNDKITALKSFKAAGFLDSYVETAGAMDLFAVGQWDGATVKANTIKSLAAGTFHKGKLMVEGNSLPGGAVVLGKAVVGSMSESFYDPDGLGWDIHGEIGAIVAGDVTKWSMRTGGVNSLTMGHVQDSDMLLDGINKLSVAGWDGGGIEAHGIGSIKTTDPAGVFRMDLTLDNSDPGRATLGSMALAGDLGADAALASEWVVSGAVGALSIKGRIFHWNLHDSSSLKSLTAGSINDAVVNIQGPIGAVKAFAWDMGKLQGGVIASVTMTGDKKLGSPGSFSHAEIIATGQGVLPGKPVIGKLSIPVKGHELTIKAGGDVGSVIIGHMDSVDLLLGSQGLSAGDASDFSDGSGGTNEFTLKSLTLLGYCEQPGQPMQCFDKSSIGAWNIGTIKLAKMPGAVSGTIEYHTMSKPITGLPLGLPPGDFELVQV